jgi:intracellular sulfur oxidation DsrE/DsrF family protein
VALFGLFALLLLADRADSNEIDEILTLTEEPPGVVIEIVEGNKEALRALLPEIRQMIARIHQKFPGLPIAIVSHGQEQFALTKSGESKYQDIHTGIREIVDQDIDVHVCGTHASWHGLTPEDFPDYVDVSPTGPAQINDYIKLGYIHIQL